MGNHADNRTASHRGHREAPRTHTRKSTVPTARPTIATTTSTGTTTHTKPTSSMEPTDPAEPFTPQPFAAAIDVTDLTAERRRLARNLLVMRVVTILLLVAAVSVAAFPFVLQFKSGTELAAATATTARNVANWPYPKAKDALAAARAYNAKLAQSGQPVLGEAVDPFTAATGGSRASGDDSASSKDKEYQSLLDSGDGVMGSIKVPKQSIDLPIYHGTSEKALASGAGHLYGSSLPVGGESTHSVITGHRGLVNAMMFTRLDEVRKGDFFYIEVMGETLGYKVDRISVILPNDTSKLKIVPGEDRVTLMTCTPYGVNTHRLLISGHRVAIPLPAPEPGDVHDGRMIGVGVGVAVLFAGWLATIPLRRRDGMRIMRHAAFWPYDRPGERGSANDPLSGEIDGGGTGVGSSETTAGTTPTRSAGAPASGGE
ncbi:sortase family protein [Bifidobacterium parmae]|uniref:Sortase family protein n=2 Tax=Bifidobacterium parmae TaxID=361854 RepID=A0A2N5J3E7_9BIFI|nr:sortase family protein [Bifidobacterium parmae]